VLHERPDNDVDGVAYRYHFLVPDARRLDARHVYAFPVCIRVRETSPWCDRPIFHCRVTQNVSRGKANILKDNSVNRCKCKRILMNTYLNLDSYRVCDCNSHEITMNLKIFMFSAYSKVLIVKSYYQSRYLCILKSQTFVGSFMAITSIPSHSQWQTLSSFERWPFLRNILYKLTLSISNTGGNPYKRSRTFADWLHHTHRAQDISVTNCHRPPQRIAPQTLVCKRPFATSLGKDGSSKESSHHFYAYARWSC